jgi:hypothetical protein
LTIFWCFFLSFFSRCPQNSGLKTTQKAAVLLSKYQVGMHVLQKSPVLQILQPPSPPPKALLSSHSSRGSSSVNAELCPSQRACHLPPHNSSDFLLNRVIIWTLWGYSWPKTSLACSQVSCCVHAVASAVKTVLAPKELTV